MIGILTDSGIGGTFLTWSIHYLRGDVNYFLAEKSKEICLIDNPLTSKNAHNFIPNQPNSGVDRGLQKLYQMHDQLKTASNNSIIYLHEFDNKNDTITGVNFLSIHTDKLILVTSKKYPLYHCKYTRRSGSWICSNKFSTDTDVIYKSFVTKFFLKSYEQFQDAGLTDVWDQREFIALNFDPYAIASIEDFFDCTNSHYVLDIAEFYNWFGYESDKNGNIYFEICIEDLACIFLNRNQYNKGGYVDLLTNGIDRENYDSFYYRHIQVYMLH